MCKKENAVETYAELKDEYLSLKAILQVSAYILREIKCSCGCDGCTVAQLKKLELELPNATQINVYEMPEMNGLSINTKQHFVR